MWRHKYFQHVRSKKSEMLFSWLFLKNKSTIEQISITKDGRDIIAEEMVANTKYLTVGLILNKLSNMFVKWNVSSLSWDNTEIIFFIKKLKVKGIEMMRGNISLLTSSYLLTKGPEILCEVDKSISKGKNNVSVRVSAGGRWHTWMG